MTRLAPVVAIIPVRSLSGAKSRLGEPLDPEERQDLVAGFLRRAIAAARTARRVDRTIVVSPDPELLQLAAAEGATPLRQRTDGLNEGLGEAREHACDAAAVLVVPGDLPGVTGIELDRIVEAAEAAAGDGGRVVAIVPDRHGSGTNTLLVAPPGAVAFRFGEGSRAAHEAEARAAGAAYVELEGPLSFDVDTPDDLLLADQAGLGHEAGR